MHTHGYSPSIRYERRKYVYKLANSGILNVIKQRQRKGKYALTYDLTSEGRFLVRQDPEFQELLERGLVKEFWQKYNRY